MRPGDYLIVTAPKGDLKAVGNACELYFKDLKVRIIIVPDTVSIHHVGPTDSEIVAACNLAAQYGAGEE